MRGKKRCQVCDGPIADGRCTLCGMPYRKDEVLYHLNENRSDHYRHATEQAKKQCGSSRCLWGQEVLRPEACIQNEYKDISAAGAQGRYSNEEAKGKDEQQSVQAGCDYNGFHYSVRRFAECDQ